MVEILQKAGLFISNKINDIRVLKGVLIEARKDGVLIKTTNVNEFFSGELGGKLGHEGGVLVDFKTLFEIVKNIPDTKIDLKEEGGSLVVSSRSGRVRIPLFGEKEFPAAPKLSGGKEIDPGLFNEEVLRRVVFSCATDDTRPILTGACFDFLDGETRVVGTDGFRMSLLVYDKKIKTDLGMDRMVVPARSLVSVLKVFGNKAPSARYLPDEGGVVFSGEDVSVFIRLLDGEYPPYEKVVPQDNETRGVLKKEDLVNALRTTSLFAREGSNMVIFNAATDTLTVSSSSSSAGEANFRVPFVEREGKENKITLNHRFVTDLLGVLGSEEVVFEMTNPFAPGVFKEAGKKGFLHIIMPIRTQE